YFLLHRPPPPAIYTLSLHDALPISRFRLPPRRPGGGIREVFGRHRRPVVSRLRCSLPARASFPRRDRRRSAQPRRSCRWCCCPRSEEHTSELQSLAYLVCRLLLEKK